MSKPPSIHRKTLAQTHGAFARDGDLQVLTCLRFTVSELESQCEPHLLFPVPAKHKAYTGIIEHRYLHGYVEETRLHTQRSRYDCKWGAGIKKRHPALGVELTNVH